MHTSLLLLPALIQPAPAPAPVQGLFNAALLQAGLRETPSVTALEAMLANPTAAQEADLRRLAPRYAPFLWALGRNQPEHPATRLLARLGVRPWAGLGAPQAQAGKATEPSRTGLPPWKGFQDEPTHAMDCYFALKPILAATPVNGFQAIVVARAGILMAQQQQDDLIEGLLWGVTAEVMLQGYDFFDSHARQALAELFRVGAETILVLPDGSMDPFKGPQGRVHHLLRTLPKAKSHELRAFMAILEAKYGAAFRDLNGRPIWPSATGRKAP